MKMQNKLIKVSENYNIAIKIIDFEDFLMYK